MSGHKAFSALVSKMSPKASTRIRQKADILRAEMPLHELRAALALSQQHLAQVLKVDQPTISRMERRTDMLLSTLASYVEAMGGRLELHADFPAGSVRITRLAQVREVAPKRAAKSKRVGGKSARDRLVLQRT